MLITLLIMWIKLQGGFMDWIEIVSSLGFPIAVAGFALWNSYNHEKYLQETLKTMIQENTEALNELKQVVQSSTWKGEVKNEV